MKSGPKPKTKKTEIIEFDDCKIAPPASLNKDAKEIWKEYAPILLKAGRLTPLDVPIFNCFCDQISLIKKCQESIAKRGLFTTNGYGTQQTAPEVRILNQATEMMLKYAKELGMTPKSRGSRVQVRSATPVLTASAEKEAKDRRARLFKVIDKS